MAPDTHEDRGDRPEQAGRRPDGPASGCRCQSPPFHFNDYAATPLGVDETHGRFGDVRLERCLHCGARWLNYHVEYEAFTGSGRWFRGLVSEAQVLTLTPETAVDTLASLAWYFRGGSYFNTAGEVASGQPRADL